MRVAEVFKKEIMNEDKEQEKRNSLKKGYIKAKGVLEQICSECHISFTQNFSRFAQDPIEDMTDLQFQKETSKIKVEIVNLIKKYYVDAWLEIAYKGYDGKELRDMISTLNIMIEMEPVHAFKHFSNLFCLLDGLNSQNENELFVTLLKIRDDASKLTTEEIINSYTELTRTKYKDSVIRYSMVKVAN